MADRPLVAADQPEAGYDEDPAGTRKRARRRRPAQGRAGADASAGEKATTPPGSRRRADIADDDDLWDNLPV